MSFREWGFSKSWSFADNRVREMLKEIYNGVLDSLRIGTATGYVEIDENGDLFLRGDSTVWDDLRGSLIGQKLSGVAGKVDYNYAENSITFNSGGDIGVVADRVMFNYQFPHACREDSAMEFHIHWEQVDAVAREFTVQYRIQSNGQPKTETWTTAVVSTQADDKFTYVSGTLNQISDLVSIDMTGAGISATVEFRLARTDSVAGDVEVTFADCHVEFDSFGSRQEYVK